MLEMLTQKLKSILDKEKIENICTFSVVKMRKICSFHICVQKFSNYLKYLPEVGADSGFSFIMLRKCLVSLEKCFKKFALVCSVIASNFPMIEMLDHFSA